MISGALDALALETGMQKRPTKEFDKRDLHNRLTKQRPMRSGALDALALETGIQKKPKGWQGPIGCLKLQVIFANKPLSIGLFCEK